MANGDCSEGQAGDADVGNVLDVFRGHRLSEAGQKGTRQVKRREGERDPLVERQPSGAHRAARKFPGGDQLHRRQRRPQSRHSSQERGSLCQRPPFMPAQPIP